MSSLNGIYYRVFVNEGSKFKSYLLKNQDPKKDSNKFTYVFLTDEGAALEVFGGGYVFKKHIVKSDIIEIRNGKARKVNL